MAYAMLIGPGGNSGFGVSSNRVIVYKGALPTRGDLNSFYYATFRSSDKLIEFTNITGDEVTGEPAIATEIPGFASASASGTATFLILCNLQNPGAAIMGSVGLPASGADFEIPDVNIVSGVTYQIPTFKFTFPLNYTY